MELWNRFMTASRAFITTWRSEQIPPSSRLSWDQYGARIARIQLFNDQYANRAYDDLNRLVAVTGKPGKYKYIRGLENPVTRIVDLYPTLCAGGAIDFEALKTGAFPVIGANDTLIKSIIQVLLWSNWSIEKSTYVRNGALTGDTVVKVVDYPRQRKVAGEVLPCEFVKEVERDASGNVKSYVIEYQLEEEVSTNTFKTYTYRETCDRETFRTFKDDKPFGFYEDENGNPIPAWDNPYGFVPLVIVPHKRMSGLQWGVNAYYHVIPKIDDMNDLASVLVDYLRREMNPSWLFNFSKPRNANGEEVTFDPTSRDQARALYVNAENAKGQSLTHEADAAAAEQRILRLDASITRDCPEAALPQLREGGNLTAPGVGAGFKDGEGRVMEAQANYDNGTVRWIQMACTMAAVNGYDQFPYNINSYDRGDLAFYVKPRPVIEDKLSKAEEISAWQQTGIDEKVWSLLGATEQEINRFKMEKEQKSMLEITLKAQQANPQLNDGSQQTTNAPAVRGSKLPTDQATKVNPITPEELAAIAAMHRKSAGANNG